MRTTIVRLLGTVLLFAWLILAACSSKSPSVTSPENTPTVQPEATDSNSLALAKIRLESTKIYMPVPTPTELAH